MTKLDVLLNSLDKVSAKGADRWIACCPAHTDRSPSLSIRYIDEKILIHCFAGCDVSDIVSSIGLTLTDLMPEKINPSGTGQRKRPRIPASDLLEFINFETLVVTAVMGKFFSGAMITPDEFKRLQVAKCRLDDAARECLR